MEHIKKLLENLNNILDEECKKEDIDYDYEDDDEYKDDDEDEYDEYGFKKDDDYEDDDDEYEYDEYEEAFTYQEEIKEIMNIMENAYLNMELEDLMLESENNTYTKIKEFINTIIEQIKAMTLRMRANLPVYKNIDKMVEETDGDKIDRAIKELGYKDGNISVVSNETKIAMKTVKQFMNMKRKDELLDMDDSILEKIKNLSTNTFFGYYITNDIKSFVNNYKVFSDSLKKVDTSDSDFNYTNFKKNVTHCYRILNAIVSSSLTIAKNNYKVVTKAKKYK